MARAKLGSYVGTAKANEDMIPILADGKTSFPFSTGFSIRKIAISAEEGTHFILNDAEIVLTETGIFETGEDMIEIHRIVFTEDTEVNIRFIY